ncbi:TRAP transporter large permease [Steroidobacter sp. S1-65]|uniref:TRAP transporter large permease protein n=1 Tax=Steroidobacter gossypii TaxID=2805490 RepID=A0ABS1WZA6_9GAMM|nr:TRAP transporter large permease [Steroidobacter gossypii]MBM0106310.1 TRAP transporter large permease [Steroidobacter gossypii]
MNGVLGVLALLVLLTLGVPIGVAMGVVGMVGLILLLGPEPAIIKSGVVLFETITRYELGVLPMFLFMAHLCFAAGASRDFFEAAARMVGHRRGGLAIASVAGCAGFGAISGSSLATAATIGLIGLPEMRKRGYSDALATGAIAAGGTLGSIIPPSGALIVFGILAEQSIGKLFTAAIIPGLSQALFYVITIVLLCRWRPSIGPATARAPWPERREALFRILDLGGLILVVLGGIAFGWFTPTEAASVGATGALLLCAWRRKLNRASLQEALAQTLRTTGMIYVVVIGALIFAVFMSYTGLADQVAAFMEGLPGGQLLAIVIMTVLLLLLGSVLDGLALMLLTTPILLPIVTNLGLSPIWFGIYLVRTMEIGFVHPPIGINLYVIQGIAKDVPLGRIFKGVVPFLAADLLHLSLLIAVPALALALPGWLHQ